VARASMGQFVAEPAFGFGTGALLTLGATKCPSGGGCGVRTGLIQPPYRLLIDAMQVTTKTYGAAEWAWLSRLRWAALVGQFVAIGAAAFWPGLIVPVVPLCGVVALQALLNLALLPRLGARRGAVWIAATFAVDVLALSALLALSGGPHNPFSFIYLVHISLAAMVLPARLTWLLVALAVACSASLFVIPTVPVFAEPNRAAAVGRGTPAAGLRRSPLDPPPQVDAPLLGKDDVDASRHGGHDHAPSTSSHAGHTAFMKLHLQGMWVAFAIAAGFIVFFVMRIRAVLSLREAELARARVQAARAEKVTSLATLAAGAAHELATPLGTIATVAREMQRSLHASLQTEDTLSFHARKELHEDARLVRSEVEDCRGILEQMSVRAGAGRAESVPESLAIEDVLAEVLKQLRETCGRRVAMEIEGVASRALIQAPRQALVRALKNLVTNGLEASRAERVDARVSPDKELATKTNAKTDANKNTTVAEMGAKTAPRGGAQAAGSLSGQTTRDAADVVITVLAAKADSGRAADQLTVRIADRGCGISEADLARIGEPFFTKKAPGGGMGLGLFVAQAVVEQLGGQFSIDSKVGVGTTVQLTLPAHFADAQQAPPRGDSNLPASSRAPAALTASPAPPPEPKAWSSGSLEGAPSNGNRRVS